MYNLYDIIEFKNVIMRFSTLVEPHKHNATSTPKYSCLFMVPKDNECLVELQNFIKRMMMEKKEPKIKQYTKCIRELELEDIDLLKEVYADSPSKIERAVERNKISDGLIGIRPASPSKPVLWNRNKRVDSLVIYFGAICNVKVKLMYNNYDFPSVYLKLLGVQQVKESPFGMCYDEDVVFDEIEEDKHSVSDMSFEDDEPF